MPPIRSWSPDRRELPGCPGGRRRPGHERGRWKRSRQNLLHDPAVDVGEPVVATAVTIGEPLVIEAHEVQDRRVQVVDVDLALQGMPAKLVGGAVHVPAAHAAAGKPHAETEGMVLAAVAAL